jgi:flagellar hook-basal body complex protein FliE
MDIAPIRDGAIFLHTRSPEPAGPAAAAPAAGGEFGGALKNALEGLNESQKSVDVASIKMAAGEGVEVHQVMMAAEQARLQLMLAVEVRNRLLEAYQEISRAQV